MKYHVTVAGRTFQVELDGEEVRVDGAPVKAAVTTVPGTPVRHLVLNGRSVAMAAHPIEPGRWAFLADGEMLEVDVVDERTRHIRSLVGAGKGPAAGGTVKAPMPGLVVRVLVEPGQLVAAGAGLVVLEAMKMENELKAPGAGVVTTVTAHPGQAVEKGQVLVTLRPE
jgi:pyruvate carboxylase subunit B